MPGERTSSFRPCGYVCDTESGLYYLQSRYYDPQVGRFINADAFVSTGQGLLGNNMFAYCLNNPLCYTDPSGNVALDAFCCVMYDGFGGHSNQEKPIVQRILEHITTTDESDITFSFGFTGAVSGYGPGIGGTAGVAVDSSCNYAGFSSMNYGVGSSLGTSAMGGINFQVTNADIVTDLGGISKSYGFSAAFGVGIAVDVVQFIPASNPNTTSWFLPGDIYHFLLFCMQQ